MANTLSSLLHGLNVTHYGDHITPGGLPYHDIGHIASDTRKIHPGGLYVCLAQECERVTLYIEEAIARQAQVVLMESGVALPIQVQEQAAYHRVVLLKVENVRYALSQIAAHMYPNVPKTLVAVTGTNGKSSVASFVRQIWSYAGHISAYWGTVGLEADVGEVEVDSTLTTPDALTLSQTLQNLAEAGITHVSLEASSIGLEQYRLSGVSMNASGFTQLSQDHLDYHGTMEQYFKAKIRLFEEVLLPAGTAVLNADVPEFEPLKKICERRHIRVFDYGYQAHHLRIENINPTSHGFEVTCEVFDKKYTFSLPLLGPFQIQNALCALGLALATGVDLPSAIKALEHLKSVRGRMELVGKTAQGATVFVDYAHTPDALATALEALKGHTSEKLWVVFGCGGDRDPTKRILMGQAATRNADEVIVTDDNPRSEDSAAIRSHILQGCGPHAMEVGDRRAAIEKACAQAQKGDIIVVAGKGHEQGQIVGDQVFPFDDIQVTKMLCR